MASISESLDKLQNCFEKRMIEIDSRHANELRTSQQDQKFRIVTEQGFNRAVIQLRQEGTFCFRQFIFEAASRGNMAKIHTTVD